MPDLLIELLSEEIPARMQARAREDLRKLITDGLVEAGLTYAGAAAFSTPRRLVLAIEGLTAASHPVREERKGPAATAPEAAIAGFLRATGLARDQLELRDDKKGQAFFAVIEKPGRPASAIVAEVLEAMIRAFPWPKSMRWGNGSLRWVRPLHSILCLLTDEHGAQVVPVSVDHLTAGATTRGHRFMAPAAFAVTGFDDYAARLKRGFVVLDSAAREAAIWHDATTQAFARGLEVVPDAGLLAEVAGLVEWPVVLLGAIDPAFLDLPPEVLQTSMRSHQKFFSVKNPKTDQIEGFVTVANRETADHGATILAGNNKVLSARLSDARFFWENDLRTVRAVGMEGMAAGLANVTFHNKLGSQADRVTRIEALAVEIAPLVGASPDLAAEAARVAKADLQSAMVGEFPELQGLMGRYYAKEIPLDVSVAEACEMHYKPLGPTDEVPNHPVSVAVALADKIDTLAGFWAIDEKPTGSKDPFALRRASLGVIRLVLGNGVRVDFLEVFANGLSVKLAQIIVAQVDKKYSVTIRNDELIGNEYAVENRIEANVPKTLDEPGYIRAVAYLDAVERRRSDDESAAEPTEWEGLTADLLAFFHDRLKVFLRDQGIRHDVIDACLAPLPLAATSAAGPGNDDLTLLVKRAEALAAFLKTDDGPNLLQGFKRANNILVQDQQKNPTLAYEYGADPKFFDADEERALFTALDQAEASIAPAMKTEDFAAAMAAMAALRAPIDAFFTAVQVNSDNPIIRRNRLNLLHRIRATCAQVADLTKIEG